MLFALSLRAPPHSTDMSHVSRRSHKVSLSGSEINLYKWLSQLYTTVEVTWPGVVIKLIRWMWYHEWLLLLEKRQTPKSWLLWGIPWKWDFFATEMLCSTVRKASHQNPSCLELFSPFWTSAAPSAASSTLRAGWLQGTPHGHLPSAAKIPGIRQGSKTITAKPFAFTGQHGVVQPQKIQVKGKLREEWNKSASE